MGRDSFNSPKISYKIFHSRRNFSCAVELFKHRSALLVLACQRKEQSNVVLVGGFSNDAGNGLVQHLSADR